MNIDETEFFHDITVKICSSLDITKSLFRCFNHMKNFIPMESVTILWYDSKAGSFETIARADDKGCKRVGNLFYMPKRLRDFFNDIELQPYARILDISDEMFDEIVLNALRIEKGSVIGLPLAIEGIHKGGIGIGSSKAGAFTEEHANILSLVHDPLALAVANCRKHDEILKIKDALNEDNRSLAVELNFAGNEEIIGEDFGLMEVMEKVRQVAPKNSPVLLLGETGTGKELIANRIHFLSERRDGPFIKVNCGAIPENLIDSELFGNEKGAFTGAESAKKGRFERADKGTIFLDEIGELPQKVQVRLLRVLQEKEILRVGGDKTISLDIRIIAATHRNLEKMVDNGKFREDLYFRLNVFPVIIPPLRKRTMDIPELIGYFLQAKSRYLNIYNVPHVDAESIEKLMSLQWKGNVRELENMIERALIGYKGYGSLDFDEFGSVQKGQGKAVLENETLSLDKVLSFHIRKMLKKTKGRINGKNGLAELLDINPNTLRNRMKKLGIEYGKKA